MTPGACTWGQHNFMETFMIRTLLQLSLFLTPPSLFSVKQVTKSVKTPGWRLLDQGAPVKAFKRPKKLIKRSRRKKAISFNDPDDEKLDGIPNKVRTQHHKQGEKGAQEALEAFLDNYSDEEEQLINNMKRNIYLQCTACCIWRYIPREKFHSLHSGAGRSWTCFDRTWPPTDELEKRYNTKKGTNPEETCFDRKVSFPAIEITTRKKGSKEMLTVYCSECERKHHIPEDILFSGNFITMSDQWTCNKKTWGPKKSRRCRTRFSQRKKS